ncbi:MAG: hypothetical protein GXY29_07485 [Thermotogaceae bacterium]|jgi:predicted Fe-Mo cluster-binding NifX family protein|nr:NifB/NifX family molybdenum-iron cluster-binding protein [Thermotogota bacterium]NLZ14017.1 hypothetical protein [Thermotogaceae bacterium]HNR62550.1 NifB/NifX family molybdenum-iron cluster-binding protein [Thermotogota bacterium]HOZ11105.1 NifB/NifX family molybdenum-iron cluster-binding protein [Thermotogota bacterium]HPB86043.1 NifB/NifX family molybdenum-iron cluster-binding protein [Thermotogota bacterium]
MKVAIPVSEKNGSKSKTHEHFGSAPLYAIVETDSGEIEWFENEEAEHGHGNCRPAGKLAEFHIDAVVCQGMGSRAIDKLNGMGMKVFVNRTATTVEEVIEAIKQNRLTELSKDEACQHHHGDH